MREKTAFFVNLPFTIKDLKSLHLCNKRKPFIVMKIIELSNIAYINFITDLTAERWYIENNKALCFIDKDSLWHCLLVRKCRGHNGVLVMSEGKDYPKYAAYYLE
jgi:hypothetical protein